MDDVFFKICIFGDGGVGKTTLVNRYLTGNFLNGTRMTIGVDFHTKQIKIEEKMVILQIWDFAGEEHFKFLLPSYVRGAAGVLFMYDITRESSLRNLPEWLEVLKEGINQKIPLIMVGGKADLESKRVIPKEIAREAAQEHNFYKFVECSSKNGQNIKKIFKTLARAMMESSNLVSRNKIQRNKLAF